MLMVVTILIPNKQVAIQFQTIFYFKLFYKGLQILTVVAQAKSYQFVPMLMVVAILIPNEQVAIQYQAILAYTFNSGGTNKATNSFQC